MTTEEFKKLKPEYENIDGPELWDAMTYYMIQREAESRDILPIWKTHTLRWLFYRKIPNWVMGKPSTDKYTSDKRCVECKNGVNARMGFLALGKDGQQKYTSFCPHCRKEYKEEPNTNFSHRLYKLGKFISTKFWKILDKLHLVRSSIGGRYEMMGDERRYVLRWGMNMETGKTNYKLRKRKWYEYILIEKP